MLWIVLYSLSYTTKELHKMLRERGSVPYYRIKTALIERLRDSYIQIQERESGIVVDDWIDTFETAAIIAQWNDVQKYVYLRKLLKGAAKLAVESSRNVCDYVKLKETLIKEFRSETFLRK